MNKLYPAAEVPEEVDVEDPEDPEKDPMYRADMNTVADLMYNLALQGRKRKLSDIEGGSPGKPG